MMDITLRGVQTAQLAALAAFLTSEAFTGYEVLDIRTEGPQALHEMANGETVNAVTQIHRDSTPIAAAADYATNLAASVFGKGANTPIVYPDPVPNDQAAHYAPSGSGVTAAPLPNTQLAAPAVGLTQGGAQVELDADGYPWDGRIHPTSKAVLVKEKTWKLIRGIDKNLVAQVRAEWDANKHHVHSGQPLANAAVVNQPITRFNDQPVAQPNFVPPANQQAMGNAAAPYTPPAQNYAPPALDFQTLSAKITGFIATQRLAPTTVAGLLSHNGVQDLPSLSNFPNLWPHISAEVDRLVGGA